jgi:hypothetical protein
MIEALLAKKEPIRTKTYSKNRSLKTIEGLEEIKAKVRSWNFDELR